MKLFFVVIVAFLLSGKLLIAEARTPPDSLSPAAKSKIIADSNDTSGGIMLGANLSSISGLGLSAGLVNQMGGIFINGIYWYQSDNTSSSDYLSLGAEFHFNLFVSQKKIYRLYWFMGAGVWYSSTTNINNSRDNENSTSISFGTGVGNEFIFGKHFLLGFNLGLQLFSGRHGYFGPGGGITMGFII